jgi:hypothetical protein
LIEAFFCHQVTTPFLGRHPELFKWFKDFVGYPEGAGSVAVNNSNANATTSGGNGPFDLEAHRSVGAGAGVGVGLDDDAGRNETERGARARITGDSAMEIGKLDIQQDLL